MKTKQASLGATYCYVLAKRPVVFPNRGFMAQLIKTEEAWYGRASIDESDIEYLQAGLLQVQDRPETLLL